MLAPTFYLVNFPSLCTYLFLLHLPFYYLFSLAPHFFPSFLYSKCTLFLALFRILHLHFEDSFQVEISIKFVNDFRIWLGIVWDLVGARAGALLIVICAFYIYKDFLILGVCADCIVCVCLDLLILNFVDCVHCMPWIFSKFLKCEFF